MLPLFVEGQFRATPIQAMLVIAVFYVAQFVAAPWLGKLSDRFGRRAYDRQSAWHDSRLSALHLRGSSGDLIGVTLGLSGGLAVI